MENLLSVILPAYNEEQIIETAANTIESILKRENIDYEIIFVNDGSKDRTWEKIVACSEKSSKIKGIHFSRNFGKEAAIYAGLAEIKGNCAIVMDCDLQHPPEKIIEMFHLWEDGYEIVEAVKSNRGKESIIYRGCANIFYSILSNLTKINLKNASDFKLLDKKAVNALLSFEEKNTFFRALSGWIGFKSTSIEFEVKDRAYGNSKWTTKSLFQYAISNICSFSSIPMQIVTFLGVVLLLVSIILSVTTLVEKINGIALDGFTTVIILQALSSSIIMIGIGIVGYYISKIYEEIQGRPKYIISKKCGND